MAWRDDAEAIKFGYGLREAEYVYQTSSYIIWPAAARKLLTELPIDGPADVSYRGKCEVPLALSETINAPPSLKGLK